MSCDVLTLAIMARMAAKDDQGKFVLDSYIALEIDMRNEAFERSLPELEARLVAAGFPARTVTHPPTKQGD